MSTERKAVDDGTPMGGLKKLCRENPAVRDELFKLSDELTSAKWRMEVKKRFSFWLSADSQVTRWRRWALDLMDQELLNDQLDLRAERFRAENPKASAEEIRDDGIAYFMEQARARDSWKQFVAVLDRDQAERHGKTKAEQKNKELSLAERRIDALERKVKAAQAEVQKLKKPATSDEEREAILDKVDEILGLK